VFLAGNFLFAPSDTFAVGCVVLPQNTPKKANHRNAAWVFFRHRQSSRGLDDICDNVYLPLFAEIAGHACMKWVYNNTADNMLRYAYRRRSVYVWNNWSTVYVKSEVIQVVKDLCFKVDGFFCFRQCLWTNIIDYRTKMKILTAWLSLGRILACVSLSWCRPSIIDRWEMVGGGGSGFMILEQFLPRDALVHSAVLRLHVVRRSVCPSVCDVGWSGSDKLEILETNCTNN